MDKKEKFLQAINKKKKVRVKVDTEEKGVIVRECIPFDYGPGKLPGIRYHFWDIDSPDGSHNLSILPEQLLEIEIMDKTFNPGDYITWSPPYSWHVARDWDSFS